MSDRVPFRSRLLSVGPALVGLALPFAACSATRTDQVERVAKDWCETIRASQVVPVYPLTQDLQPGDVFLVQVPIEQQQRQYAERGFLPLDQHLVRLELDGYGAFYRTSFLDPLANVTLPRDWLRGGVDLRAFEKAPRAAFPSYGFTTSRGAGLSLAVPVKGVPVGLSLLGTDQASGSITIADARTFGIDIASAWRELRDWSRGNHDVLVAMARRDGPTWLRMVTRVYLTGRIDVQLTASASSGGGLDVGAPKTIDLQQPSPPAGTDPAAPDTTMARYQANLEQLNEMLAKANETTTNAGGSRVLPGGSLRVTAASGRTIALQDTFDPPLVVGYLGFDCRVLADGSLGPPTATGALLRNELAPLLQMPPAQATESVAMLGAGYRLLQAARNDATLDAALRQRAGEAIDACDRLAGYVEARPDVLTQEGDRAPLVWKPVDADVLAPVGERTFADFLTWQTLLLGNERLLARAVENPPFLLRQDQQDVTVQRGDEQHQRATRSLAELRARLQDPALRAQLAEATGQAMRTASVLLTSSRNP